MSRTWLGIRSYRLYLDMGAEVPDVFCKARELPSGGNIMVKVGK